LLVHLVLLQQSKQFGHSSQTDNCAAQIVKVTENIPSDASCAYVLLLLLLAAKDEQVESQHQLRCHQHVELRLLLQYRALKIALPARCRTS